MASDVEVSGGRTSPIDPLRPLATASRLLAVLVLGLLVAGTVAAVFGSGSVLTIGDDPICVTVTAGRDVPLSGTDVADASPSWGLAPRVSPIDDQFRLCQDQPGAPAQVF